ncbi:PE domain-containing protein [Mycolicibacterium sphagni]|uniref:PE domain-containing protein n=1 Tax=Mycolicibacterium sphagni TaxID=1786 RepID=A0ABX2JV60_9MYCO|nr:PE domain-containing protein [Mycolicibacterium sphagni]NTY60694.1 PE domain-containing protein [Mycolicibacterium sphagni]
MQPMSHDAAATAASGAELAANGAQGIATGAAAAASLTGLPPAGAEEVSAQAAAAFSAEGAETLAQLTAAQEELTRAGAAFTKVAGMYSAIDGGASNTLD